MFTIILVFLLLLSLLEFKLKNISLKNKIVFFMIVVISLIEGLRVETGTDWIPYERFFYNEYRYFEIGYTYLNKIVRNLTNNYIYFLFGITFFKNIIIYRILYKITNKLWIIPIFYGMTVAYIGANRQWIAIAFVCLIYKEVLLLNRKKILYYLILGYLFHKSILLIIPLIILDFFTMKQVINIKKYTLFLILTLLLCFILKNNLYNILNNIMYSFFDNKIIIEKLDFYTGRENRTIIEYYKGIFKYMILFILNILLVLRFSKKNLNLKKGIFVINGFFYGILVYILFSGQIQTIVSRGGLYTLYIYIPLMFCYTYDNVLQKIVKKIIFILAVMYMLFTYNRMLDLNKELFVPYKSIFFNKNYKRNLY